MITQGRLRFQLHSLAELAEYEILRFARRLFVARHRFA